MWQTNDIHILTSTVISHLLVWLICLMAYQLLIGDLMQKSDIFVDVQL